MNNLEEKYLKGAALLKFIAPYLDETDKELLKSLNSDEKAKFFTDIK